MCTADHRPDASIGAVRIVSLNAWGGAMFDELAAWVPQSGADVLCLQEVTRTPGRRGWTHFADGERTLPQRADLFDDLCALLPGHRARFDASDAGPVLDADGRTHHQGFGLATFVDGHIVTIHQDVSFVHGTFVDHEAWPTSNRPRIAQGTRIVDGATARTVTVIQLHGLRDQHGKGDTPARRAQAERVAQFVDGLRAPDDLTVVCGDLNLLPHSETFDILGAIGLVDLVGEADTRTSRYAKPVRHAGYLLVSDPGAVRRFEVLAAPEVSDHRALVLDV
jgi:endonuclease/exonuclease/phosphatase family metal-dependent hydrolase